jgi:carboxyl-terminal processing protease
LLLIVTVAVSQQPAPKIDSFELQRDHLMLRQIYEDIRKNYYDPTFHGVDLDKAFQQFDARLNTAQSPNEAFRVMAAFMLNLRDSHTFFEPPARKNRSTPGYFMQMIGDKCFITRIRPGTDAAAKLHVGDQVLTLHGFKITPEQFHNIQYFIALSPSPAETLELLSPTGERRQETVKSTLRTGDSIVDLTEGEASSNFWKMVRDDEEDEHLSRSRYFELGDTFVWRMPSFEVDPNDTDKVFSKAEKDKNLIIDLRGNSGGYIETLKFMLGHLVDKETKLGDRVTRKETKAEMFKPRKPYYAGNVIVLVDHNSASAAELFARVVQLEHRGKVIGDRSAGAVMEAHQYVEETGTDYKVYYGLSITDANILMTDGKSLENTGVTPDEVLLPTAADLAAGRDPVLAHAVELAGQKLDPLEAGKHFPYEWPKL